MAKTIGELLVDTLVEVGVGQVFGVVGDALNPFTDAIRREPRIRWLGVRHEEGAALRTIPQDVLEASTRAPARSPATLRPRPEIAPAPADLDAAARLIDGAKTVALFVGHGAASARAEVLALAERLQAPVVHTYR